MLSHQIEIGIADILPRQSCFGQNLIYGGPQSVIFGLIVAFFAQWTITLGLSELASSYPVNYLAHRFQG